jgi:hypothetical protein
MSNIIKLKNKTTTGTSLSNLLDREALVNDIDVKAFIRIAGNLRQYLFDEDLKAGSSSLNQRLITISKFTGLNIVKMISGQYYDNSFRSSASSSLIGAADRIELAPYFNSDSIIIDKIGCSVATGMVNSFFKIVIYSSILSTGLPGSKLYESVDLSGANSEFVEATLNFTFKSETQYWVGVRHSGICTLRSIPVASALNLGLSSSNAANYNTVLRRSLAFATAAPSSWNFLNTDLLANVTPPSIRFRVA